MTSVTKTCVIIDSDPGVDDIIAILLAIASPELDILAYIISYGNTDLESSYLNLLKAYQAIGTHLEKFPEDVVRFPNFNSARRPLLAKGSSGPLQGEIHSAQSFHGRDGLGDIAERHCELDFDSTKATSRLDIVNESGVDAALNLLRSNPSRSITYIALGPLTNLALMMRKDKETVVNRIGRVICMGGALDVPGNTSPVAEFNFFADPYAVKELLVSTSLHNGLPLDRFLLVPLDITTLHELPFPIYKEAVDSNFNSTAKPSRAEDKPPITHFTSSFLEKTREIMLQVGKDAMELHDIVAVWCAIENPPLPDNAVDGGVLGKGWKARRRIFEIERTGELTRGMLVVDRRDDESAYAPGANRAEVQKELERLHPEGNMFWESTALPAPVEREIAPASRTNQGISCVTHTPGPEQLLCLILKCIWGVEVP